MTSIDLTSFQVKTVDQLVTDWLTTYSEYLQLRGNRAPNTAKGTEIYGRAYATAIQIAVATANTQVLAKALMPDTAEGTDLERIAAINALFLKPAGGSSGGIDFSLTVSTPVLVAQGAQLLDVNGQSYAVLIGGAYSDGDRIPIQALSSGQSTNLPEGSVLKWVAPPAFASSIVSVSTGGLTGGTDAEDIEGLRSRLLALYRDPPGGGNAAQLASWAEGASSAVQNGFVYACNNGGATAGVCVVRAPTSTDRNRDVDPVLLSTVIAPYLVSQVPEWVSLTVTTPTNQPVEVSIGLSLPVSAQAGGPGGGWINATPFPVRASLGYVQVDSVTTTTVFQVTSDVAPTVGVSQIAWVDPTWVLRTATVLASNSLGSNQYQVTIDQPFTGLLSGHWVFPLAANTATYVDALLTYFGTMGPGEVTNLAGLLPRALRSPSPLISYPSSLGSTMLRAVENTGDEVLDTSFLFHSGVSTSPTLPGSPLNPPSIFVPSQIGLYPI